MKWLNGEAGAPGSGALRDWPLSSGDFFNDVQARSAAKVCVVGATVVKELFGARDPVGQVIRIRNMPFRVLGVLSSKGQNTFGMDQDDVVVAPLATVQKKIQRG